MKYAIWKRLIIAVSSSNKNAVKFISQAQPAYANTAIIIRFCNDYLRRNVCSRLKTGQICSYRSEDKIFSLHCSLRSINWKAKQTGQQLHRKKRHRNSVEVISTWPKASSTFNVRMSDQLKAYKILGFPT